MKLLNAFSLSMLGEVPEGQGVELTVEHLRLEDARQLVRSAHEVESCIGHADTAALLGGLLGIPVEVRRVNITLQKDEACLVAQYTGPRLPEGATTLPEGAVITWYLVTVEGEGE